MVRNPRVRATLAEVGIAQAELWHAATFPNPVLDLLYGFPRTGTAVSNVGVGFSFVRALQLPLRRRVAAAELESTQELVADAVLGVMTDVQRAHLDVQHAQQVLELRTTFAAATAASAGAAKALREAGNVPALVLVSEQAMAEQSVADGGDIAAAGQWPETTVLVPVGTTRTVEFVADNPGDWAMHCHMTHHVMNQMGHRGTNMVGADPGAIDALTSKLLPDYMTMGETGMGGMAEMGMPIPDGSISMLGGAGPHGHIDMGGMFTILKIRERLPRDGDSGWYRNPPGTVAVEATADELRRDGISG